jgi:hypothetical protein
VNGNLVETRNQHSHLRFIATLAAPCRDSQAFDKVADNPAHSRGDMEKMMRGRVMMILASALLAGSLVATGAQARGGGGGGHGGFGGGHMGGFGGGHMTQMGHDHFGAGRHHFIGGLYGGGSDCPYYDQSYTSPYNCTY